MTATKKQLCRLHRLAHLLTEQVSAESLTVAAVRGRKDHGLLRAIRWNERLWNGRSWRILLKKSFLVDEPNFLAPLVRPKRGDVRDRQIPAKAITDRRTHAKESLQQRKQIRTDVRGIFEAARFSTFSTVSAQIGPSVGGMSRRRATVVRAAPARPPTSDMKRRRR